MNPAGAPEIDPTPARPKRTPLRPILAIGLAGVLLGAGVAAWASRPAPAPASPDTALASLTHAAQSSAPFAGAADRAAKALPASDDLTALRELAASGVPSSHDLAASFPKASVAAASGHAPTVAGVSETVPDAVLARAEKAAAKGDIQLALCDIAALPPKGQAAISSWREAAQKRVAVEQRLAALRPPARP